MIIDFLLCSIYNLCLLRPRHFRQKEAVKKAMFIIHFLPGKCETQGMELFVIICKST